MSNRRPPVHLSVCAVYEDIHAWRDAWRLLEDLRASAAMEFAVNWFSFEELPLFQNRAGRLGAEADLTLLSTSQRRGVPEPVHLWLLAIRNQHRERKGSLVGLISNATLAACPWECLLADTAQKADRDLFVQASERPVFAR